MDSPTSEPNILSRPPSTTTTHSASELPLVMSSTGRTSEACRQVLENDDILQQIFEEFDRTGDPNGNDNSNRHSLLSAALSSSTLLGASLDVLWKTMSSLVPFLKLFSSFQEVNGVNLIYGSITPEDWTRFHNYARRTKSFMSSNSTSINEIHVDPSTFIRLARHSAEPLFPSLRRISYREELRIVDPFLLLSPSIERIDLAEVSQDSNKALALLSMLSGETPGLKSLNIVGTSSITARLLRPITQLENLRSLNLGMLGQAIDNEILQWIASLNHLTSLVIDLRTQDSSITIDSFVGLNMLTSFSIVARAFLIQIALEKIGTTCLEELSITTWGTNAGGPRRPRREIFQQWTSLSTVANSRWNGSLRKLFIKHESPILGTTQFLDVFAPLLRITTLEELEVKQAGTNLLIDTSQYQQMGLAWKNLRLLHIDCVPHNSSNLTDILQRFLEDCRNLTSLELPITVVNVPANLPPEFISFHKLKFISFALIQVGSILAFARYLDCLFPNLIGVRSIRDSSVDVEKTIKIFQAVRSYERSRMFALWK